MHFSSKSHISIMALVQVAACFAAPAFGAKPVHRPITHSKSQVMSHPKSPLKIVLSGYRHSTQKGSDETMWEIVSVQTPDGKLHEVANAQRDEPGNGYQPGDWSPDGQYFTLFDLLNFDGPTEKQEGVEILGLKEKKFVSFSTQSGVGPTWDNSGFAWMKGKPHSIKVRDAGKESEALPQE